MPSKVCISVVAGSLEGKTFEFAERATLLVGRGQDCQLKLPNTTDEDRACSRHHCLLDINPPDIRVRDLGSLNGTRVNDQIIGKRRKGQSRLDAAKTQFPEHDLKSGDQLTVGTLVFQTEIVFPLHCAGCSQEIPANQKVIPQLTSGAILCRDCSKRLQTLTVPFEPLCAEWGL